MDAPLAGCIPTRHSHHHAATRSETTLKTVLTKQLCAQLRIHTEDFSDAHAEPSNTNTTTSILGYEF